MRQMIHRWRNVTERGIVTLVNRCSRRAVHSTCSRREVEKLVHAELKRSEAVKRKHAKCILRLPGVRNAWLREQMRKPRPVDSESIRPWAPECESDAYRNLRAIISAENREDFVVALLSQCLKSGRPVLESFPAQDGEDSHLLCDPAAPNNEQAASNRLRKAHNYVLAAFVRQQRCQGRVHDEAKEADEVHDESKQTNMVIDENEEANDMTLEQLIRTSEKKLADLSASDPGLVKQHLAFGKAAKPMLFLPNIEEETQWRPLLEKLLAPVKTAGTNINTNKNICKDLKGALRAVLTEMKIEKGIETDDQLGQIGTLVDKILSSGHLRALLIAHMTFLAKHASRSRLFNLRDAISADRAADAGVRAPESPSTRQWRAPAETDPGGSKDGVRISGTAM